MKSRFAPSPTGAMHLGNARTALLSALLAKKMHGTFLLRIEDTDAARSAHQFSELLQADLKWLDLSWQEGPYFQSERQSVYAQYYEKLLTSGDAYHCFCSDTTLALTRKAQLSMKKPPRYPGTCRHFTADESQQRIANGERPTLRFRIADNTVIEFVDLIRGKQIFNSDDIGDCVIRRADGSASFLFCSALDDALMNVTHVLRGEDHLTNTPRQLLILQALQLTPPNYGHISLILGDDGGPLSKREGSLSIETLRASGFLPSAINNYLARLGHHYETNAWLTDVELANQFSFKRVSHSPARYDADQLLYWQRESVARLDHAAFQLWVGDVLNQIPAEKLELFIETIRQNIIFPKDVVFWMERLLTDDSSYEEDALEVIRTTDASIFSLGVAWIEQHGSDSKLFLQALSEQFSLKGKALYAPIRAALTGVLHGPELARIFLLLGKERLIDRLAIAEGIAK